MTEPLARFVPAYNASTDKAEFKPAWLLPNYVTLTLPDMIDITGTSATPQVYVTYNYP